jgi:hypothetical protein
MAQKLSCQEREAVPPKVRDLEGMSRTGRFII